MPYPNVILSPLSSLPVQVREAIQQRRLLQRGESVLVGVSGGADSVVLLHVLRDLAQAMRLSLHAVHVNHQLRASAHADAAFVENLCRQWQIPCTVRTVAVARLCAEHGWGIEEGARQVRYRCFGSVALQYGIEKIALAHHADDQAETVLLRLLRGSGLAGLRAMAWQRPLILEAEGGHFQGSVVRPLLNTTKQALLDYAQMQQLSFVEDETNIDRRFLRNRVRHELLPLLRAHYNANIDTRLFDLSQQLADDYAFLEQMVQKQWKRLSRVKTSNQVVLQRAGLMRQAVAVQRLLVRKAIEAVKGNLNEFEFRHWLEIQDLVEHRPSGSIVDVPGARVQRIEDSVRITRAALERMPA
jgi:tRNA(Ile)-lysidine synthase